jgi:hypothetical protein
MIILHLTDLHFGLDPTEAASDERQLALDQLIDVVAGLDDLWKPTIICLSGDVAYAGKQSEYALATSWLLRLMSRTNIAADHLIVCPGNHDIERAIAMTFARPSDPSEADQCLGTPIAAHYLRAFANFSEFCEGLGVPKYGLGDTEGYLTGVRCLEGVRFVSMNSSWFCRDKKDSKHLWIGLPLLRHLEAKAQWPKEAEPCIGLLHHPREDFAQNEITTYTNRLNTYDYICDRSDILLSGHTHGGVGEPARIANRALVFTGGATYASADYYNNFSLLKLVAGKVQFRAYEFDPRTRSWQVSGDTKERAIGLHRHLPVTPSGAVNNIQEWNELSLADIRRIRERKSRAATPFGDLPKLIDRQVGILRIETRSLALDDESTPKPGSPIWPLYEAVRRTPGKKALLLGELGTGKSTLLCEFVEKTLKHSSNAIAFMVPGTALKLTDDATVKQVIAELTRYFNEQIGASAPALDLQSLLAENIEITLAVDGFDEMNPIKASKLLAQLATAVEYWPTLQVVAASRPIELYGIDYSTWNVLTTLTVNQAERRLLFRNELEATGATNHLEGEIDRLESEISQHPFVLELLHSPLAIRLSFSRLRKGVLSADLTLGDLLIDTIEERLGTWSQRDLKPSVTPQLDSLLPTPRSRAQLLGEVVISMPAGEHLTKETLIAALETAPLFRDQTAKAALAEEAFRAFSLAGIIQGASDLSFSVQAFKEMILAYGLTHGYFERVADELGPDSWREVSFSAALCRRTGNLNSRKQNFERYLRRLLRGTTAIPSAATIIVESQDPSLAKVFVEILSTLGSHPLNSAGIDRNAGPRAIATALRLAGDIGFSWFFSEYLDPRYPVRFAGSAILGSVFSEWLFQVEPVLRAEQTQKLSGIIRPHISAGTYQVHDIVARLSLIAPSACTAEERVYFASTLLSDPRYRERACSTIDSEYNSASHDHATAVLGGRVRQGFEDGGIVASLLLEKNPGRPPALIIGALLRSLARLRSSYTIDNSIKETKHRLGTEIWERLLLWFLFDVDESAAASAAILLSEDHLVANSLLRTPLLRALHDGAYVKRAEEILAEILSGNGEDGILWLADQIRFADKHTGGHSGWWRLLLENVQRLGRRGPKTLADCVGGFGPFVLPRYPEIRQKFRELLSGEEGTDYRGALRSQLDSIDPVQRLAAAAILVTSDPKGESKALLIAVQRLDEWGALDWHEWYDMCLTLSFDSGTLVALESHLESLGKKASQFAVRLLFRNGTDIADKRPSDLLRALLSAYSRTPEELSFLSASRKQLIDLLPSPEENIATQAAEVLLEMGDLDPEVEVTCWILISERQHFSVKFEPFLSRIMAEPTLATLLAKVGESFIREGKKPLLPILATAVLTGERWKEVLWFFFMKQNTGPRSESEVYGLWALTFGRANPSIGVSIGSAAKELLEDPMLMQQQRGEPVQWIALLADEFSQIDPSYLEKALVTGTTIEKQAACALISRLGSAPPMFVHRNRSFAIQRLAVKWEIPDQAAVLQKLRDFARPSDQIPEETCTTVVDLLNCDQPPTEDDLKKISIESPSGALIAIALRFCLRRDADLASIIATMGRNLNWWEQNNLCNRILVEVWRATLAEITKTPSSRSLLIAELQRHIIEKRNIVNAAAALLSLGEPLSEETIPSVLETLVSDYANRDDWFLQGFTGWVLTHPPEQWKNALERGLSKAIALLNLKSWNVTELGMGDAKRFLTIPLCYAIVTGELTPSACEVFYRGVKLTAVQEPRKERRDLTDIFEQIAPLVGALPGDMIATLFKKALVHQDAVVRSIGAFATGILSTTHSV